MTRGKITVAAAAGLTLFFASAALVAVTYEYDTLNRLTKVTYDDGAVIIYDYDAAGNRTVRIASSDPSAVCLAANAMPSDCGSVTTDPIQTCSTPGESVTLTPVPSSGCVFAAWSGAVPPEDIANNPLSVLVDDYKIVTANFTRVCPGAAAPESPTVSEARNRYLSLRGGNAGQQTAIRITLADLPAPYDTWNGNTLYIGEPHQVCENSGQGPNVAPSDCAAAPGSPAKWFWAAPLVCIAEQAHVMDWSALASYCVGGSAEGVACATEADCPDGTCGADGTVHLYHAGIIPSRKTAGQPVLESPAVFQIQAADALCDLAAAVGYSAPLELTQAAWGDVVGAFDTSSGKWLAPDGQVDVATDVVAVLDKFANAPGAPSKTRVDLEPAIPDLIINITDVTVLLDAFSGTNYPFEPPAWPCS